MPAISKRMSARKFKRDDHNLHPKRSFVVQGGEVVILGRKGNYFCGHETFTRFGEVVAWLEGENFLVWKIQLANGETRLCRY